MWKSYSLLPDLFIIGPILGTIIYGSSTTMVGTVEASGFWTPESNKTYFWSSSFHILGFPRIGVSLAEVCATCLKVHIHLYCTPWGVVLDRFVVHPMSVCCSPHFKLCTWKISLVQDKSFGYSLIVHYPTKAISSSLETGRHREVSFFICR